MIGTETVQVKTGVRFDRHNNPLPATGTPTPIRECVVEPLGSEEMVVRDRRGTYSKIRVFMPVTTGVDKSSVVTARGLDYEVVGDPDLWIDDEDPELSGLVLIAVRGVG